MSDRFGNIPIQPQRPSSSEESQKKSSIPARKRVMATTTGGRPKKTNRGNIIGILIVAILLLTYTGLGFFGVPYYISHIVPQHFLQKTGAKIELIAVTFNPYTFQFTTGEIRVTHQSSQPIFSLQTLEASLSPRTIIRQNFVCNMISISGINLNLERDSDGVYNFNSLLWNKKERNKETLLDLSSLPFQFSLNNIAVTNGKISFSDVPTGKVHLVEKIELTLPSLSNIPFQTDQYLRPRFSAVVNGSPVELSGRTGMGGADSKKQITKLTMELHDLDLTNYADYLPFDLSWSCQSGKANGTIELLFNPQIPGIDKLSLVFQLQISAAKFLKKNESLTISVPVSRLQGKLLPFSKTLHFTEMTVKEPVFDSFETAPDGRNGSDLAESREGDSVVSDVSSYQLIIDRLLVDNGRARLFPNKDRKEAKKSWDTIQLSIKDYNTLPQDSQKTNGGSFNLSGEKEGTSSYFSWQGRFTAANELTGKIILTKTDFNELFKAASPDQTTQFGGHAELDGQLSLILNKDRLLPFHYSLTDAKITVEDFAILDNKEKRVTAPVVKFSKVSFSNDAVSFGNIQLQKAEAHFIAGQLPTPFTSITKSRFNLKGLEFDGSITFHFPDNKGHQLIFTAVSLKANNLDQAKKTPNNLSITAKTEADGLFQAQGNITLSPFSMSAKTGFKDLRAASVFQLFSSSPLLGGIKGQLSGKGQFNLPLINFAGELQLSDVSGKYLQKTPFSLKNATFRDFNYTARPFHLGISLVVLDQAELSWQIDENDSEAIYAFTDFFTTNVPEQKLQPSDKPRISFSPLDIQTITFSNSRLALSDQRLSPPWTAELGEIEGKIQEIHLTKGASNSTFTFAGKLDASPFTLTGEVDPSTKTSNGSTHFTLQNYPLASFHQQLKARTDLDTNRGHFNLTLDGIWQDQQYVSRGEFIVADFEPIDASSPSALQFALLAGADDTFRLPFEFSRTEPIAEVSLFNEALQSFQRLILKGSVSPLLLASGNFTDLIDNDLIEFKPGEFMLSEKGRNTLVRYGALLMAHPRLGLVLSDGLNVNIDLPAMEENLQTVEQRRIDKENEKLLKIWQDKKTQYEKSLAEKTKPLEQGGTIVEKDIPLDVLNGFQPLKPQPVKVDETMLLELGQKRIDVLNQYFRKQLSIMQERIVSQPVNTLQTRSHLGTSGVFVKLQAVSK